MSEKNTVIRADLLKFALLVRPALSKHNYIPALQHIALDGRYATAYNDISAISVRLKMDVERLVPGELLIRALQSFSAESVLFQQNDAELLLSSGRSKIKLPTLPRDSFPLKWPEDDGEGLEIDEAVVKGIERCLPGVGNDPNHPEAMGVTLDSLDGRAHLYSTDAFSVSRYATDTKLELPGEAPVILPTFFCEQLIALARAFDKEEITLYVLPGALMAEFGDKARLLTKTLVDREPLDFPGMFKQHLKAVGNLRKELAPIPASFDASLQRALLVLEGETDKVTAVTLHKDSFKLASASSMGEANDQLPVEEGDVDFGAPEEIYLDPAIVARGVKSCALMGFMAKSLVLADEDAKFTHLVSYCSK